MVEATKWSKYFGHTTDILDVTNILGGRAKIVVKVTNKLKSSIAFSLR